MQLLDFSTENMSAKVLHRPLWPITPRCTAAMPLPTRWGGAPDPVIHGRHKPYKMAENKWATGIITLLPGVITPLIKGRRGRSCTTKIGMLTPNLSKPKPGSRAKCCHFKLGSEIPAEKTRDISEAYLIHWGLPMAIQAQGPA